MSDEMFTRVATTIEAIRPALQADGGDIVLHRVHADTGIVEVELTGACAGCPSSNRTLKVGVERIVRDRVDGVTEVVDINAPAATDAVDACPVD